MKRAIGPAAILALTIPVGSAAITVTQPDPAAAPAPGGGFVDEKSFSPGLDCRF